MAEIKIQHAQVKLKELQESKTNPRKHFDAGELKDLTASVKEKGVIVPLLVRPIEGNGHFEIIAGARRFRAATAAELGEVPCIVRRDLDDKAVLEIQVIENLQRADVHPLDEAEGYVRLHKEHGLTADELAAKVGKSKAYIYARMKLAELPQLAKALFWDGKLNPSTALLVARIGDPALAEKAAKEISQPWRGNESMSYRDAFEHIQSNYMLKLSDAGFDVKDAQLCPKAGSCVTCPKRTGNQPALFQDVKGADVCTDPVCFHEKREAQWQKIVESAKVSGTKVLSDKESKEVFPYDYDDTPRGGEYVSSNQSDYRDPQGRHYGALLGKDRPEIVLARNKKGAIVELMPKRAVDAALRDKYPWAKPQKSSGGGSSKSMREQQKADATKREAKLISRSKLVAAILAAKDFKKAAPDLLPSILFQDMEAIAYDVGSESEFWKKIGSKDERGLRKKFEGRPLAEILQLRVEFELYRDAEVNFGGDDLISRACRRLKIDAKKLEAEILKALKAPKSKPKGMIAGVSFFPEGVTCSGCGSGPEIRKFAKSEGVFCAKCKARVCGKCGCTEDKACEGGCSWAKDGDQCSVCEAKKPAAAAPAKKAGKKKGAARNG